jgi:hypothetical protein
MLLPHSRVESAPKHLDFAGAITVTLSLMLAVYAIVGGNQAGWLSLQTLGLLSLAAVIMGFFIYLQTRVRGPLMPLSIFKLRSVAVISVTGILWSAAMFAWFFLSALYLQLILHYTPLEVGLAFLPANLIMAAFSVGLSAKIVMRFGTKLPLIIGMASIAVGLVLFGIAPANGDFYTQVLPGMVLLGIGAGLAFNPVLLMGMSEVPENEAGLASGVLNTAFMMGGSLGLAVLASLAASQTMQKIASGINQSSALLEGYHAAFMVGALFAALAALLVWSASKERPVHTHVSH